MKKATTLLMAAAMTASMAVSAGATDVPTNQAINTEAATAVALDNLPSMNNLARSSYSFGRVNPGGATTIASRLQCNSSGVLYIDANLDCGAPDQPGLSFIFALKDGSTLGTKLDTFTNVRLSDTKGKISTSFSGLTPGRFYTLTVSNISSYSYMYMSGSVSIS